MADRFYRFIVTSYYNVLDYLYKLFYKLLQWPAKELNKAVIDSNNTFVINYNNYIINDIKYDEDTACYYGQCKFDNEHFCLKGATIDLLINDLIEGLQDDYFETDYSLLGHFDE